MSQIPPRLLWSAMPTCEHDGCEKPWIRVEWKSEQNGDGDWVPVATAVCEYGHRIRVEPTT